MDVELFVEAKRVMVLKRCGHARKRDLGAGRRDAQTDVAPECVFSLLHVPEEPAEVDDSGRICLVEMDSAAKPIFRFSLGCHLRLSASLPADPTNMARRIGARRGGEL